MGCSFQSNPVLVLARIIGALREKVFTAWTEADFLKQWFAPRPWTTPVAETDVRPGGASLIIIRSPDGNEFRVFTDGYAKPGEPAEKPFMTVILTFEDAGATQPARVTGQLPT